MGYTNSRLNILPYHTVDKISHTPWDEFSPGRFSSKQVGNTKTKMVEFLKRWSGYSRRRNQRSAFALSPLWSKSAWKFVPAGCVMLRPTCDSVIPGTDIISSHVLYGKVVRFLHPSLLRVICGGYSCSQNARRRSVSYTNKACFLLAYNLCQDYE